MKMTFLITSLLLGSLASCNAILPEDETPPRVEEREGIRPTPGYNSSIAITPSSPGQPVLWVAWNFNGNVTAGSPASYSVFLGSSDTDFVIGGASADKDTSYTLVITDLGGTSPTATLTPEGGAPSSAQAVTVTTIDQETEAFAVSVRDTNPPSADLYLCVTHTAGGVKILLEDA